MLKKNASFFKNQGFAWQLHNMSVKDCTLTLHKHGHLCYMTSLKTSTILPNGPFTHPIHTTQHPLAD